jgi:hypothetical protein
VRFRVFGPTFVVDRTKFQANIEDQHKWYNEAVEHDWFRFVVPGKTTLSQHIVFTGASWEGPTAFGANFDIAVRERGKAWRIVSTRGHAPINMTSDGVRPVVTVLNSFVMSDDEDEKVEYPFKK